ncbi:hypothetical protein L1887_05461 [Cichorium endivia]|nr:hypothetical protein L1887_05461 [Cichorium endivia]
MRHTRHQENPSYKHICPALPFPSARSPSSLSCPNHPISRYPCLNVKASTLSCFTTSITTTYPSLWVVVNDSGGPPPLSP